MMRVRRNITKMSAAERKAFVDAVLKMKSDIASNPSVLFPGNPNLSRYDDYVETHKRAMLASPQSWAHLGPAFGPWHRVLIREFEKDLQKIDASVTVPYWNWVVDQSTTDLPWTAECLGGDGEPNGSDPGEVKSGPFAGVAVWPIRIKDGFEADFLERGFGRRVDAQNPPDGNAQDSALQHGAYAEDPWHEWLFDSLRGPWEGPLHNLVHRWVFGNMMTASSPNDPVFWLHHGNIDRLWAVWQQLHPNSEPYLPDANNPNSAASGHNHDDNLIFHASGPAPWLGTDTPGDLVDHHSPAGGGVWYDTDPPVVVPQAMLDFGDVADGETDLRDIAFDVTSPNPVEIVITAGPSSGFTTPLGTSAVAQMGENQVARIWIGYGAPSGASDLTEGSVTIRASTVLGDDSAWEQSWTIALRANVTTELPAPVYLAYKTYEESRELYATGEAKFTKVSAID